MKAGGGPQVNTTNITVSFTAHPPPPRPQETEILVCMWVDMESFLCLRIVSLGNPEGME